MKLKKNKKKIKSIEMKIRNINLNSLDFGFNGTEIIINILLKFQTCSFSMDGDGSPVDDCFGKECKDSKFQI